jgi:hypothetical protein
MTMDIDKPRGMLEPPWLVPIPILTPSNSGWVRFKALFARRKYCLGRDWFYYNSAFDLCVIPGAYDESGKLKGLYFVTDGKSYPRFMLPFMSPLGIGLVEGLVHDGAYRYQSQMLADGRIIRYKMDRHICDEELRVVGIHVNNLPKVSQIAYRTLRVVGIFAWRNHRKNDGTPANDIGELGKGYTPHTVKAEKPTADPFKNTEVSSE